MFGVVSTVDKHWRSSDLRLVSRAVMPWSWRSVSLHVTTCHNMSQHVNLSDMAGMESALHFSLHSATQVQSLDFYSGAPPVKCHSDITWRESDFAGKNTASGWQRFHEMARLQCLVQTEEVVVLGHLPMVWASIRRAHMILLLLLFLLLMLHNYRLWLSSSLVLLFIPYNQSIESIAKDVLTFLTFSWRSVMSKMSMRSRDYQFPKVPSVVLSPSPSPSGNKWTNWTNLDVSCT
jgi:hypothetical protein